MLTPLNEIFREKSVIGDLTVYANPFGPVFRHPDAPLPSTDKIGARPDQDMTALRPRGLELVILEQQPGEAASQGGPFGLGNFGAGPFLLGKCWAGEVRHGTPGGGCAQSPLARLAVRPRLCRSCHVRLGPWPISPYRRRCRAAAVTKGRVRPGRRFWWGGVPIDATIRTGW